MAGSLNRDFGCNCLRIIADLNIAVFLDDCVRNFFKPFKRNSLPSRKDRETQCKCISHGCLLSVEILGLCRGLLSRRAESANDIIFVEDAPDFRMTRTVENPFDFTIVRSLRIKSTIV